MRCLPLQPHDFDRIVKFLANFDGYITIYY